MMSRQNDLTAAFQYKPLHTDDDMTEDNMDASKQTKRAFRDSAYGHQEDKDSKAAVYPKVVPATENLGPYDNNLKSSDLKDASSKDPLLADEPQDDVSKQLDFNTGSPEAANDPDTVAVKATFDLPSGQGIAALPKTPAPPAASKFADIMDGPIGGTAPGTDESNKVPAATTTTTNNNNTNNDAHNNNKYPEVASASQAPTANTPKGGSMDHEQFMWDTIMWQNPIRSAVYMVGGLFLLSSSSAVLHMTSMTTVVSYLMLAQLSFNFCFGFTHWSTSMWGQRMATQLASLSESWAIMNDKYMSAQDTSKALKAAGALWMLSLLGRLMGTSWLLTGLYLAAFTMPRFVHDVQRRMQTQNFSAKAHWDSMDRRLQAALVTLPLLLVGFLISNIDFAIACFIAVLYVTSLLKPNEVDAVSKHAKPITATASKLGGQISSMAAEYGQRFDLTPMSAKAQRGASKQKQA